MINEGILTVYIEYTAKKRWSEATSTISHLSLFISHSKRWSEATSTISHLSLFISHLSLVIIHYSF